MSTLRISTAALALATAAAIGAAPAAATAAPGHAPARVAAAHQDRVVTARDGGYVVLHRGDTVALRLTACESCGYRWVLAKRPSASVVDYRGRTSTSTACAGCVGGNAVEDFSFVALRLGQTQARFAYRSPSGTVTKRVTVSLVVLRKARSTVYSSRHVVRPGDTLYRIARAALRQDATPPRVKELATRLYRDNRAVIGSNPSFLLPGEMLLVDVTALDPCGTTAQPASRPCNG